MLKAHISKTYSEATNAFDAAVTTDPWAGANIINTAIAAGYDTTPTFPVVHARVELRRAPIGANPLYVDFSTTTTVQYYRIMGVSSVTVNSDVIYSTVSYYFYVVPITVGTTTFYRKRFAAWREHKTIQNDNGTIQ